MSVFEFEGKEIRPYAYTHSGLSELRCCGGRDCPQFAAYGGEPEGAPCYCKIMQRHVDSMEVCPPWAIIVSRRVEKLDRALAACTDGDQLHIDVNGLNPDHIAAIGRYVARARAGKVKNPRGRTAGDDQFVETLERRMEGFQERVNTGVAETEAGSSSCLPDPSCLGCRGGSVAHTCGLQIDAAAAIVAFFRGKKTKVGDLQAELLEEAIKICAEARAAD